MIQNISLSLEDLLGADYMEGVCRARAALTGENGQQLLSVAKEKIAFCPEHFIKQQETLMRKVGTHMTEAAHPGVRATEGAPTDSYRSAQNQNFAPMNGYGCFRIGEDGRLCFAGKSEHYHIPLGHSFPGYELIEKARRLGIPNATHNNTRGYVTRLLEQTLIEAANGVQAGTDEYQRIMQSKEPGVLNRVINLETGSLVAEAALKMMLSRFYSIDGAPAKYEDRIPVFLVMGDNQGGITAGYHGTTFLAQTLRGLWPAFSQKAREIYRVEPVKINDAENFREAIQKWNQPPYKTAGFCHELILMNYSAVRLSREYIQTIYRLCRESDTAILCDEIQSCAWYDSLYLFRKYGVCPDFLAIGKGFPGGCYAASKVLVSGAFDTLNQFGALVTNGQEELASLSYLITIAFLRANSSHIPETGDFIHKKLSELAAGFPEICDGVEGDAHMTAIRFKNGELVTRFCKMMNSEHCIDISAQTYKANCPPVALTKLPLIVTPTMVELLADYMRDCLLRL